MISLGITLSAYAVVVLGAVAIEIIGRRRPTIMPSFAAALTRGIRMRTAALGLVLAWWWLGWHFITYR